VATDGLVADPGSLEEIGRAIADRRTDPVALLESTLRRIEAVEKEVQGWCVLDRERAFAQAQTLRQEAEAGRLRGPLHGIPVAIKDVIDVAGLPTRAGSATRAELPPRNRHSGSLARRADMSQSAWSMAAATCAKGPGSPHWSASRRVRSSSMDATTSGLHVVFASSGSKMLRASRARCSAPTCGKLQKTSPQPHAPSEATTRRNSAGRFVIAPNAFATGTSIGARKT